MTSDEPNPRDPSLTSALEQGPRPPRRVRLVPLTLGCLLVAGSIVGPRVAPQEQTLVVEDSSSSMRFVSYVHHDAEAGAGQRHKGEEGQMGVPTSKNKSGIYAMKGPKDAVPQLARSFDPEARNAGILGLIQQDSSHFLASPYGAAFAVGNDDEDVWGGLTGTRGETYAHVVEQGWRSSTDDARSTFSIDVDTAAYANVRRHLHDGALPPADAVRLEEMINYFDYAYRPPAAGDLVAVDDEVGPCPWNPQARLLRIGVRAADVAVAATPARNLVFLVDVSGSMDSEDKLPLVQQSLRALVERLDADDHISLVVYAGAAGVVLQPTAGDRKTDIVEAIERLQAGGSTNGGEGIELAYTLARRNFDADGVNRVILATDGDFNVGTVSHEGLFELIEDKRKTGVYLSVLGFGTGNLDDATMELLADKGNGNYAYIDSLREAKKVLVREAASTLVTIADDVKLQVEFHPDMVASHRLVGYDNRRLAHADFTDDRKDAGEMGAGHTVTALYEIVLREGIGDGTIGELAIRAKRAGEKVSSELEFSLDDDGAGASETSEDFRFAAAAAGFGLKLRASPFADGWSWHALEQLADGSRGADREGERAEMVALIGRAMRLNWIAPLVDAPHFERGEEPRMSPRVAPQQAPEEPESIDWIEVLRLLPPLLALPMFVMAFRPRRRRWDEP